MTESVLRSVLGSRVVAGALAGVAALALLGALAGCASKRDCGCACGPERVWVPAHTETTLRYAKVCATTRMKTVEVPCIRREPLTVTYQAPVYADVRVQDVHRTLAPTTECVTVPTVGYQRVGDVRPVLRGVCQMQCQPRTECGTCGTRTVYERKRVKIGERLVEVPAGSHLEEIPVGCERREVTVGEHEVVCCGSHVEEQQVGTECRTVVTGERRHVEVGRRYEVPVVTRPAHWTTHVVPLEVPGWWATITCDPSKSDGHDVLTRAEYEALKASYSR